MIFKMTISFVSFGIFTTQVSGRGEVEKKSPPESEAEIPNCLRDLGNPRASSQRFTGATVWYPVRICSCHQNVDKCEPESYRLSKVGAET